MCRFPKPTCRLTRAGLTLLELLIASSIMAIMVGVLGALALSVQMHNRHSQGQGEAVQHARVVLDRLQRKLSSAHATPQFPGFAVFADQLGPWEFPDTIVIWTSPGASVDPSGLPRWNELTLICPDPERPNVLLEVTSLGEAAVVPPLSDVAAWRAALDARKESGGQRVELTPLVRTAAVSEGGLSPMRRAAVRFETLVRPSDAQWDEYQAGTRAWNDLDWVQGICGTRSGMRQSWCRIELQLIPGLPSLVDGTAEQSAVTFFGSAAVYYEMRR